jgi:hypothetical protein
VFTHSKSIDFSLQFYYWLYNFNVDIPVLYVVFAVSEKKGYVIR